MQILKGKDIYTTTYLLAFFFITLLVTGKLFSGNGHIADESESLLAKDAPFPYELTNPSKKLKLPHYLDEISGISYIEHEKLACIQDEEGTIYIFDCEEEKVTEKYKFGKDRDYEDIEIIDTTAYILQSNGNILKIENFHKKDPGVKRYKTFLSRENDTEGLAFDYESNSLLIACKGSPHLDERNTAFKGKKAIYKFDLNNKRLSAEPVYTIDIGYLKEAKGIDTGKKYSINSKISIDLLEGDETFQPSGIAIHPLTRDIYIVSSVGKMLIVLNQKGAIIAAKRLSKRIFKQPEGICFSPAGDLFISNESKDGRANILKFEYYN